ncbi:MAG: hypothetical protein QOH84_5572 [Kribbellaceae bacterium]|nr:hypothetical protein [Kribbellaceae bacterium]
MTTTPPPGQPNPPYPQQPGQHPQQFPHYGPNQGQPQFPPPQAPQYGQPGQGAPQYGQPGQGGPQYGQPGQGGPQPQYGQQPYPQQNYAPPQPPLGQPQQPGQFPQGQQLAQGQPGLLQCRFCGGVPAVEATVRGHQGFLVMMRLLKLKGPFCKTCGTAATRDMTAKSMWQGWWGVASVIFNPITMLANLGTFSKFKNLPEPAPGAPGRPMELGKPLFKRPAVLGLLIPFVAIPLLVAVIPDKGPEATIGSCVYNKGTADKPNVKVVDCASSDADYKVIGRLDNTVDGDQCAKFQDSTVSYTDRNAKYTLCLTPN